jgi:hypothetical protein
MQYMPTLPRVTVVESWHHSPQRDTDAFSHTLAHSLILSRKPLACCYTPLAEKIDALCLPYATRAIKHAHRHWCNVEGWWPFLAAPTFSRVYCGSCCNFQMRRIEGNKRQQGRRYAQSGKYDIEVSRSFSAGRRRRRTRSPIAADSWRLRPSLAYIHQLLQPLLLQDICTISANKIYTGTKRQI